MHNAQPLAFVRNRAAAIYISCISSSSLSSLVAVHRGGPSSTTTAAAAGRPHSPSADWAAAIDLNRQEEEARKRFEEDRHLALQFQAQERAIQADWEYAFELLMEFAALRTQAPMTTGI